MGEFVGPLQEQLVLPERWGGHKLKDACVSEKAVEGNNENSGLVVDLREIIRKRQLQRLDEEARSSLKRLLNSSAHIAAPQFKKGEQIDLTRVPIGQVLRFERDKVQANKDGKPIFSRGISWGVVSELDQKRFVIEFDKVQSQNGIHHLGWSIQSDIPPIVGDPIHLGERGNIQGRQLQETIERVNWVHVISPTEPLFQPRSFIWQPERPFKITYQPR